uniref:Putative LRR receptor-like serine/threonine-protein kinase n=1 Tax=Aegilops tauschii TaxID=37682 RepID=R7WFS5_AEGTA
MHPPPKSLLILLLHAVLLAASPHALAQRLPAAACTPQERDALLAFKQGITISSDTAGLLASWREDDCCQWRGVRCSNRTGHVVALNLRGHELVGEVPPHLGNFSKLHYLDLSSYANVYSEDISWLRRLPFLRFLSLIFIDLSTVPDWAHVVNALPLRSLHPEGCSLTSANQSLPHSNLTSTLEVLNLSVNKFDHPVASCWFWNLTRLKHLYLDYNKGLYGPLPDALGGMVSLQELSFLGSSHMMSMASADLKNLCNLSGEAPTMFLRQIAGIAPDGTGTLANWMGHRTSLVILDLSVNNITGPIPKIIGQFIDLKALYLSVNHLTGHLPSEIGTLTNLSCLHLSQNHLDGLVTEEHFNGLKSLERINLADNQLEIVVGSEWVPPFRLQEAYFASCQMGPLFPAWLKWQVDLTYLDISSAGITGQIPLSVCELSLYSLDLANNLLEGELPQCFSTKFLGFLLLSNNKFSGKFPPFLENCTMLSFFDLARNRFSGTLPMWIGNLGELQFLRLSNNMFHGHIPNTITSLRKLYHLNLAANGISGSIPHHLSNLIAMTTPYVEVPGTVVAGFQDIVGDMPVIFKRRELKYKGVGVLEISSIDFSCNRLTGKIPEEITTLGGLINLNLSWNQLNGGLPNKVGGMQALESLDFSNNDILGGIPSSWSNLTYLSILDLSYNHPAGIIPSGGQLDTLYTENPSIYNGNIGLCGPILHKSCSVNNNASHPDHQQRRFVAGLWVVFCALLFKKAWRIAYFRFFDKVYDKAYVFIVVTWGRLARKR